MSTPWLEAGFPCIAVPETLSAAATPTLGPATPTDAECVDREDTREKVQRWSFGLGCCSWWALRGRVNPRDAVGSSRANAAVLSRPRHLGSTEVDKMVIHTVRRIVS